MSGETKKTKQHKTARDEFSCCCCGIETEMTTCEACGVFECGERTAEEIERDGCLAPENVAVWRTRHAAHYANGGGHDLLTVEATVGPQRPTFFNQRGEPRRPERLPFEFQYHSGHRDSDGWQRWRWTRSVPMSHGSCSTCAPKREAVSP